MTDLGELASVTALDEHVGAIGLGLWESVRRRPLFWGCTAVLSVLVIIAVAPEWFAGWFGHGDPRACDINLFRLRPSSGHPFGTDTQGCDIWANVIYGTRASLEVGLIATALSVLIAVAVGTAAGWFGGWVDSVIARTTDVFLGFPFLLGAIVVLTTLRSRGPVAVGITLALFTWPTLARTVRGSVRAVRDTEFVQAARLGGLGTTRILVRHVLPNALRPLIALATLLFGGVVVAESVLTFLGVGLQPPTISWGQQMAAAQARLSSDPHLLIGPSIFLTATAVSLILLGDLLGDALDPKGRR